MNSYYGTAHDNPIGYGSAYKQAQTYFGTAYEESHSPSTEVRYKSKVLELIANAVEQVRSWFGK